MYSAQTSSRLIGRDVLYLPECGTTNTELQKFVRSGEKRDGLILITDHQWAGRGQGSRTWTAEPGRNLTFSILLIDPVAPSDLFYLNVFCALAVSDAIMEFCSSAAPVVVKWPNDVWLSGKKTCGILVESVIQGNTVPYAIAGIGINVNQTHFPVPAATSLKSFSGREWSLPETFNRVVTHLDRRYAQVRNGEWTQLMEVWMTRLYRRGECHRFEDAAGAFEGVITGVDGSGRLMVSTDKGMRIFAHQEIRYI